MYTQNDPGGHWDAPVALRLGCGGSSIEHQRLGWKFESASCGPMILLMEEILHPPVEVGSLSHHLQGLIHPRWLAGFLPSTVSKWRFFVWLGWGGITLPETNSELTPENWCLEDEIFPFGGSVGFEECINRFGNQNHSSHLTYVAVYKAFILSPRLADENCTLPLIWDKGARSDIDASSVRAIISMYMVL